MRELCVLECDPDLGSGLAQSEWAQARVQSTVAAVAVPPGPWRPSLRPERTRGALGILVVHGMLAREVRVAERATVELLGGGDVLRPWTWVRDELRSVPAEAELEVLTPTTLAFLDREFAARMAPWPEVAAAVVERAIERAHSLAVQMTIARAPVEDRVLMMLWHLADRWGRVGPDGTQLRLPRLTHQVLARLVGATRPTVTSAMAQLRSQGAIERLPAGHWMLLGEPPSGLVRSPRGQPARTLEVANPEPGLSAD